MEYKKSKYNTKCKTSFNIFTKMFSTDLMEERKYIAKFYAIKNI